MNNFKRASNVDSAAVIQVIQIYSVVGSGTEGASKGHSQGSPVRQIVEYYSMDGELLARRDGPIVETGKQGQPG